MILFCHNSICFLPSAKIVVILVTYKFLSQKNAIQRELAFRHPKVQLLEIILT